MDLYHPRLQAHLHHHQEEMLNNLNHKAGLGEPCLVLTSDPKPRLRWTADLHDRFVDAVTQLGGPNSRIFHSPFVFSFSLYCLFLVSRFPLTKHLRVFYFYFIFNCFVIFLTRSNFFILQLFCLLIDATNKNIIHVSVFPF